MRLRGLIVLCLAGLVVTAGAAFAGAGDYASGEGFWHGNSEFRPGGIGFEGIDELANPGSTEGEGEFDYRNMRGQGFHARVVCVEVNADQEAFLGLVSQQSTSEVAYKAYAKDNGQGSGTTKDLFNMRKLDDTESVNCSDEQDLRDEASPVEGNIFVFDSGA